MFEDNEYKMISSHASTFLGVKIFVTGDVTDEEQVLISGSCNKLYDELQLLRYKNNPEAITKHTKIVDQLKNCFENMAIYAKEIPSEYDNDVHSPWLMVTTRKGLIKIGWRYRVINIDWSESDIKIKSAELFGLENVTMYDKCVHAWGYDKAREYIGRLMYS